ncbi:hypothetical protein Tco_0310330, partial [Tanacetum coccineum]
MPLSVNQPHCHRCGSSALESSSSHWHQVRMVPFPDILPSLPPNFTMPPLICTKSSSFSLFPVILLEQPLSKLCFSNRLTMSESMPTIPTQSTFTYPNPNPSASPSFTQDDTSDSFIPKPIQPMPTFTQTAFSQPAVNYQQDQPNQSIFSQPAIHFQQTQPTQTNQTGQQYPNNVQSQQFQLVPNSHYLCQQCK